MHMLARGVALARAVHPAPAATVTAVAGLLALAVGHTVGSAALVTATVGASQLAVGWSNDAIDAGRDAALRRTEKPIVTGAVSRRTVAVAAALATAGTVLLALRYDPVPAALITLALVSALAYNWPLKLTVLSPLPYAVSFGVLPAFVVAALPATPPVWLIAAGALLGAGAHFANALPDLAGDAATGVRGLPQRLGATGSAVAAAGLLLGAAGGLVVGPPGPPAWWGWGALVVACVALPAGWYAGRAGPSRALFRAFLVVALINVTLLLSVDLGVIQPDLP